MRGRLRLLQLCVKLSAYSEGEMEGKHLSSIRTAVFYDSGLHVGLQPQGGREIISRGRQMILREKKIKHVLN